MHKAVIGILAHVDAGKTTLSEALLYRTGAVRRLGRVDHRDAFLDTDRLERERGITIFSKQAVFPVGEYELTLLDTPGHVDFSAEMERTLQVLDYAILVVSGTDGVQAHTLTVWKLLQRWQVPVFIFVNKTDLLGFDRETRLDELRRLFDENCLPFDRLDTPDDRAALEEAAALSDESAMDEYLDTGSLADGTLRALYRIANGIDTLAYSQEGGKALLADVSTVLQAVAGIEERGTCSENIAKMAKECASSLSGREIVYARDVRAAGVALCLAFVALGR